MDQKLCMKQTEFGPERKCGSLVQFIITMREFTQLCCLYSALLLLRVSALL